MPAKIGPNCCCTVAGCANCTAGTSPSQIQAVLNMILSSGTCMFDCQNIAGTYILDPWTTGAPIEGCSYRLVLTDGCGYGELSLVYEATGPVLTLGPRGSAGSKTWIQTESSPYDCTLTNAPMIASQNGTICSSPSTVSVTSIA